MAIALDEQDGQTPLDPDEKAGLIPAHLAKNNVKINPTVIETYCIDRQWDGPKAQSIRNSKDVLMKYVELRRSGQKITSNPKKASAEPNISDESIRAYVQLLKQEPDQAIASRARIEAGLRSIPGISVDALISTGFGGLPKVVSAQAASMAPEVLAAVKALLDDRRLEGCGLELYKDRICSLVTRNVLLEKAELAALQQLLTA